MKTRNDALRILDRPMQAMSREIALKHRILARKCHPDEWNSDRNFTTEEGREYSKEY